MEKVIIWRWIPGYEEFYLASNTGLIRSIDRIEKTLNNGTLCTRKRRGKMIKGNVEKNGYCMVLLSKNGEKHKSQLGRWIALAFSDMVAGEYFEGAVVDHIDGNPLNNCVENLRWCSQKDNINNPITLERKQGVNKGRKMTQEQKEKMSQLRKGKPNPGKWKPVSQYSLDGVYIQSFKSRKEARKYLKDNGIPGGHHISDCIKGKRQSDAGFKWL